MSTKTRSRSTISYKGIEDMDLLRKLKNEPITILHARFAEPIKENAIFVYQISGVLEQVKDLEYLRIQNGTSSMKVPFADNKSTAIIEVQSKDGTVAYSYELLKSASANVSDLRFFLETFDGVIHCMIFGKQ